MLTTDPNGSADCHFKQAASRLQNLRLVESLLKDLWSTFTLELNGILKASTKHARVYTYIRLFSYGNTSQNAWCAGLI